ncbi:MAG: SIMPL domain-containing protein [bacterium]|nr:SIMPL domain-containing protein [bacterium]
MNTEHMSGYQKVAGTVALLAVAYAVVVYAGAYSRSAEPTNFRSFSVSAEGRAIGVPDVAQFSFSVVTQGGKDLAALQTENTKKVNAAIAYVKGEGVAAKDVKTSQYSVEPRYQYFDCSRVVGNREAVPCPPPEIVGYTVTQSVEVKARDFEKVGGMLSGVVTSGANTVSQLNFTVDDPTKLEDEARAEAIKKAQAKAKQVADAGRFSIGRLLGIDEGGGAVPYYRMESAKVMGMGGADNAPTPAPAVEPGSQDIRVSVTLRYEIR